MVVTGPPGNGEVVLTAPPRDGGDEETAPPGDGSEGETVSPGDWVERNGEVMVTGSPGDGEEVRTAPPRDGGEGESVLPRDEEEVVTAPPGDRGEESGRREAHGSGVPVSLGSWDGGRVSPPSEPSPTTLGLPGDPWPPSVPGLPWVNSQKRSSAGVLLPSLNGALCLLSLMEASEVLGELDEDEEEELGRGGRGEAHTVVPESEEGERRDGTSWRTGGPRPVELGILDPMGGVRSKGWARAGRSGGEGDEVPAPVSAFGDTSNLWREDRRLVRGPPASPRNVTASRTIRKGQDLN
ncbi:hypothetical protein chiPu_0024757 [Chiloscyllium punctatum]|uniref:Uncharacterized protein n=1 Tax=Chiloscyllium punctatum TaxID=137246 RepID=A0A401TDU1_CHIPU|nr:hypothetical protein [Chiloscyllium punctatum]